jgi:hypothetical protein
MPDFSQVLVNLRRAFSKDSPGLTITPVMEIEFTSFPCFLTVAAFSRRSTTGMAQGREGNVSSGQAHVNK